MRLTGRLRTPRARLVALGTLLLLGASVWATPGFAQTRIGNSLTLNGNSSAPSVPVTNIRFNDTALDTTNGVYLVVFGSFGTIRGRFIGADGQPVGPGPFQIPATAGWTDQPRVAYSPDSGLFMVIWNDSRAEPTVHVYGRTLAYQSSGVPSFPGTDFDVSQDSVLYTTSPGIAYAVTSHLFLVAFNKGNDIRGRLVNSGGTSVSSEIAITSSATDGETDPDIAYNVLADEFYVTWRWWLDPLAGVRGRRVTAGTGALPDATWIDIDNQSADDVGPAVPVFDRDNNRYLVAWYRGDSTLGLVTLGRFVTAAGTASGSRFTIAANGTHNAIGMARNPLTGTFLTAFAHHDILEVYGAEVSATGTPGTMMALTYLGAGPNGIDYTRVTTNATQAEWLVTAAGLYTKSVGQRIASAYPGVSFGKSSPATGVADLSTPVTLTWQAAAGATLYEVCVDSTNDNTCNTSWQSAGTSTTIDVSPEAAGTYYWQVRATVSGRIIEANSGNAWWNFTVGATPPAPVFGKVSPTSGTSSTSTSATLTWGAVTGAGFEVCYDTTNDSACGGGWQWNGTSTTLSLSGLAVGTYYWQVRAATSVATQADSGTWWSFTVAPPPALFNKTAPTAGATVGTVTPTFSWTAASGATSYSVCINTVTDTCVGSPFMGSWTSVGSATSWQPSFSHTVGTTYYWQVRTIIGSPIGADNNVWFAFTAQPTFDKISPVNGTGGLGSSVTLTWSALSGLTSQYWLCVDTTPGTSCETSGPTAGWKNMIAGLTWTLDDLANGTYYWHVRTGSPVTESNVGTWWNFTVGSTPLPPFTDSTLTAGTTPVKAVHITELRQAIDTLRTRYSLTAVSWTDATLTAGVTSIKAVHLTELRTALSAVYTAAGRTPPTYTNATVTGGTTVITVVDIAELRTAIAAIW